MLVMKWKIERSGVNEKEGFLCKIKGRNTISGFRGEWVEQTLGKTSEPRRQKEKGKGKTKRRKSKC